MLTDTLKTNYVEHLVFAQVDEKHCWLLCADDFLLVSSDLVMPRVSPPLADEYCLNKNAIVIGYYQS